MTRPLKTLKCTEADISSFKSSIQGTLVAEELPKAYDSNSRVGLIK